MEKYQVIDKICTVGLVAVIRADSCEVAYKTAKACLDGGISAVEITFTVPGAQDAITRIKSELSQSGILVGAGTVFDAQTARIAILAGAEFIVSPCFDKETAMLCNRYSIPYIPGVMTVKELISAMEYGSYITKLFPGDVLGQNTIKAFTGPVPSARMMPTGNVDLSNIGSWIKAGSVAVGVGGALVGPAKNGDYNEITERAKEFCKTVKKARNN